ncbi:MAG TPA: sigma-70 family RNA polymerase sigma factor [Bacillota bacterium]|nr:sigma-70 family RNA polymerase sigma factor [Bacillota bacterium]
MEPSDLDLVEACLGGNHDSFAELINRYQNLIFKIAHNLMDEPAELDDIVQDVFVKIYQSLGSYNSQYKFSTWAIRITTNHCLDLIRARTRQKMKLGVISMETVTEISGVNGAQGPTPESQYIVEERNQLIRRALQMLPEKYRLPMILFHQNELPYEEIARVLQLPLTIVKNRLYRARLILRQNLRAVEKEGLL